MRILNFPDCTPFYDSDAMDPVDLKRAESYPLRDAKEQFPKVTVATYEHQIGVLVRGKTAELYVYDWTTGDMRMVCSVYTCFPRHS